MIARFKHLFGSLFLVVFFSLFFILSCNQGQKQTMDENTFARTLGELMVINRLSVPDSVKTTLVRNLFQNEHINEKDFLNTKATFKQDEVFWQRIYRKAQKHIKEMEKRLQSKRLKK